MKARSVPCERKVGGCCDVLVGANAKKKGEGGKEAGEQNVRSNIALKDTKLCRQPRGIFTK